MNKDQYNRAKSAINEDMGIEHKEGSLYEVKGKYEVDAEKLTCECPDYDYRNNTCKHILRVTLAITWGNVPAPDTDDSSGPPKRPQALIPMYDQIPPELKAEDQWVCWEYKRDSKESHKKDWTKVPIDVNGGFASSTNSDTWVPFEEAKDYDAHSTDRTDGVGFVVQKSDDLIGIDIDNCRDADTGKVDSAIKDLFAKIGSYTEVSPSGTGLRCFVMAEDGWPLSKNQTDMIAGGDTELEVYEWGRYLTVTGYHVTDTPQHVTYDEDTVDLFAEIMKPGYSRE